MDYAIWCKCFKSRHLRLLGQGPNSPPIRHLFAENAAPRSNDCNGEVALRFVTAGEWPRCKSPAWTERFPKMMQCTGPGRALFDKYCALRESPQIQDVERHTNQMIVQACINGARPEDYHPSLPLTTEAMIADAEACISSGAGELHIHPRDPNRNESLAHVDELVRGIRTACPGTLVGVSTGAWIVDDIALTRQHIRAWSGLPDYASVNLSEADAPGDFLDT